MKFEEILKDDRDKFTFTVDNEEYPSVFTLAGDDKVFVRWMQYVMRAPESHLVNSHGKMLSLYESCRDPKKAKTGPDPFASEYHFYIDVVNIYTEEGGASGFRDEMEQAYFFRLFMDAMNTGTILGEKRKILFSDEIIQKVESGEFLL